MFDLQSLLWWANNSARGAGKSKAQTVSPVKKTTFSGGAMGVRPPLRLAPPEAFRKADNTGGWRLIRLRFGHYKTCSKFQAFQLSNNPNHPTNGPRMAEATAN